jgi:hypothetical protein
MNWKSMLVCFMPIMIEGSLLRIWRGAVAAFSVSPMITVLDQYVIDTSKEGETKPFSHFWQEVCKNPGKIDGTDVAVTTAMYGTLFSLQGALKNVDSTKRVLCTSMVGTIMGVYRDVKMLRRTNASTVLLFAMRDAIIFGIAFSLPTMLEKKGVPRMMTNTMIAPTISQSLATPLHCWGLEMNHYSKKEARKRVESVLYAFKDSVNIRILRTIILFGVGNAATQ